MADLIRNIGMVSQSKRLPLSYVTTCAAAIQKQVERDFGPIWDIKATVQAFDKLAHVPADYWPVLFRDSINAPGAAGYHTDRNNQPYALCLVSGGWTVTASHEVLEMLGDPFGNRTIAGPHPRKENRRVLYLVEVCDPSEAFSYKINGVSVSDFYTPHYFDPVKAAGVKYSFMDLIDTPRKVIRGGYLSFYDPTDRRWHQVRYFGSGGPTVSREEDIVDLELDGQGSIREQIDRVTAQAKANAVKEHEGKLGRKSTASTSAILTSPMFEMAAGKEVDTIEPLDFIQKGEADAAKARAEDLEADIEEMLKNV